MPVLSSKYFCCHLLICSTGLYNFLQLELFPISSHMSQQIEWLTMADIYYVIVSMTQKKNTCLVLAGFSFGGCWHSTLWPD